MTEMRQWTRRRFLRAGVIGVVGGLALAGLDETVLARLLPRTIEVVPAPPPSPDPRRHFRSRPDLALHPVGVLAAAEQVADGYVFLSPGVDGGQSDGLVMVDNRGEPAWLRPQATGAVYNFKVQQYRDEPVLTWWEGAVQGGHGSGEGVIADVHYREIARIQAADGYACDMHEFRITPQGTALITAYALAPHATAPGGQPVLEGVVQEIDIATGRVRFEWHSYPAVALQESYVERSSDTLQPYDYFHVNSVAPDLDGHLLVSARNTWAVYKLDHATGQILWRLGGKQSDFAIGPGASFSWQHDALREPDGTLVIFDDEAPPTQSRGIVLEMDETARTVALRRAFTHPTPISSDTRGNVQVLPNGNVFIGWGGAPFASEFGPTGDLRFDLALWPRELSYRAFRFPWHGQPGDLPAVAVEPSSGGGLVVYVSWNGATEVARWQILAGATPSGLRVVASVSRSGFETIIPLPASAPLVAARALNATGAVLGTSAVVRTGG